MFIVKKQGEQILSIPAGEISLKHLRHFNSELVSRIIEALKSRELYPKALAQQLGEHEQKVYYHIKNLERAGIVVSTRTEKIKGSQARYFTLAKKGFFIRLGEFEKSPKLLKHKEELSFLSPFIAEGQLNALIVTGSPDPHGPSKARSRDGYYGIDLGLFLGTHLDFVPKLNVKLDTEIAEPDLKQNLILIGGPIVNRITEQVNSSLPVFFEHSETTAIRSSITGNSYPEDEMGIIVKSKNPFDKSKSLLVVAGKRHAGTRAAIIGILKHFSQVAQGNKHNSKIMANVVEGFDLDSDGIVDEVEFKE
jgi:DNA-binding transcriptional ArsR family regulator